MYDEKKQGEERKNGKVGWMKVIRGTRSAERGIKMRKKGIGKKERG